MRAKGELASIQEASEYIDDSLALANDGQHSRQRAASRIVGLAALDLCDQWDRDWPEFQIVWGLAGAAEVTEPLADDYWPQLMVAAARLREVTRGSAR